MEIDHIQPTAKGGTDEQGNLWLACPRCNGYKSDQTSAIDPASKEEAALFNPRLQRWNDHFENQAGDPAIIVGKTYAGRATIESLRLNSEENLAFRRLLVSVKWYP